jgi:hypothetical protein
VILFTRVECDLKSAVTQMQLLVMPGFGDTSAEPHDSGGSSTDFSSPLFFRVVLSLF